MGHRAYDPDVTIARGTHPPRRPPPPAGAGARYRGYVRASRVRRGRRPPRLLGIAAWALLGLVSLAVLAQAGATIDAGTASLASRLEEAIARAFPAVRSAPLELDRVSTVQAEPVVDQLPEFTSVPSVLLQGHLPSLTMDAGRRIEIALNGAVVGRTELDAAGRFAQHLTLRDGENSIVISLLQDGAVISSRSATSVLDRNPPPLAIIRPTAGETIGGPTVQVDGTTEPGTRITVNGRNVVAAANGTFSESFSAAAGAQPIEVVALDRAGNETRSRLEVTVAAPAGADGVATTLALDRARVGPAGPVVALVTVVENGRPKADVAVTLLAGGAEVGSSKTRSDGSVTIGFAAPMTEGEIVVLAITSTASARATLTVAR